MRKVIIAIATVLLALAVIGCQEQPAVSAGAMPPTFAPVGPIPGFAGPTNVASNPYATDTNAMTQGRMLFDWYNCSGCHGGHGGGGMGPSLRDQTWIYGSTDADIFNSIAEGRGKGMPAWGLKVPEEQIWQLVAYIKTLGTPEEVDPPE